MKLKKILALFMVMVIFCTACVSVGAISEEYIIYDIHYEDDEDAFAATAIYTLIYNENMNCVKATNAIRYERDNVHVTQRNFPGYINMDVEMNTGYWFDYGAAYLATTSTYTDFSLNEYYIPAGKIFVKATAYFETNYEVEPDDFDGQYYYANSNYTGAYTSQRLMVT